MSGKEIEKSKNQVESAVANQGSNELQNIQTAYRLTGKNYLKWCQLVRTFLKGKGKLSHLIGTGPQKDETSFKAWDEEDSKVMSWLWNSMEPEISDTCMFLPTAKDIWESEMDHYRCIEMKCSSDVAALKKFIEKDRVYDFLAGLNTEFDQVRVQILGKEELPTLNETISIVRTEESRRGVMLEALSNEGSAMLSDEERKLSMDQTALPNFKKLEQPRNSN
ncbi:hypothetical protein UlMin_005025 [Ulmus minor]